MLRAIKYELNPTKAQKTLIKQSCGCCRKVYGTNTLENYPSRLVITQNSDIVGASETWKIKAKDGTNFYYQVTGYNDSTNPLVDWTETSLFELKFTDYKQYDKYQKPFNIWLASTPRNL